MKRLTAILLLALVAACGNSSTGKPAAAPTQPTVTDTAAPVDLGCTAARQAGPVFAQQLIKVRNDVDRRAMQAAQRDLGHAAAPIRTAQSETTGSLSVAFGNLAADLGSWRLLVRQHEWAAATSYMSRLSHDMNPILKLCP